MFVGPLPDIMQDRRLYKAKAYLFWIQYIAPIVLKDKILDKYYRHLTLLHEIIMHCLLFQITSAQIDELQMWINNWVTNYENYLLPAIKNCVQPYEHLDTFVQRSAQMHIMSQVYDLPTSTRLHIKYKWMHGMQMLSCETVHLPFDSVFLSLGTPNNNDDELSNLPTDTESQAVAKGKGKAKVADIKGAKGGKASGDGGATGRKGVGKGTKKAAAASKPVPAVVARPRCNTNKQVK
ncbi:hypothetical protein FRC06_010282 [Ceratobasidium sp. 370]|nr:hypothetical protein FRC06_010282 [Ceratobasidium sp. 370]